MKILADAIPFCFGPAVVLQTLLETLTLLAKEKLEIDILSSGSTKESFSKTHFPAQYLAVDSEDPAALSKINTAQYDFFLNVCNPVSYEVMHDKGIPIVYEDFLLWMCKALPPKHFGADLYIAENYPSLTKWLEFRRHEVPNLYVIPPIIKQIVARPRKTGYILVTYGGQYSKLTIPRKNTNYDLIMTQIILDVLLKNSNISHIKFTGSVNSMRQLSSQFSCPNKISFEYLSHNDFLSEVAQCETFITQPGLYAPFEAMFSGTPTIFLPPSNYTQILQLRHFRDCGLTEASCSWDDYFNEFIPDDLPEPEGVAQVLNRIKQAEKNCNIIKDISIYLSDIFSQERSVLIDMGKKQQRLAMGFGQDGVKKAANAILDWWEKRTILQQPD